MIEPLFSGVWILGDVFQYCGSFPCREFEENVNDEVDPGHDYHVMAGLFVVRVIGGLP